MTTDKTYSANQTGTTGASQSGTATGRSPEYDDGLTVQDTSHSAAPGASRNSASTDTLGGVGSTGPTTSTRDLGDNRDGAGRDRTDAIRSDETGKLISADKVVGTAVYDAAGERLGTIDSIMLGKQSGKVAFAVMSFGGFLGIGERYHPLPWSVLTYDHAQGGYNVQRTADDLRKAPNYSRDEVSDFDYGTRSGEINDYYGVDIGAGAASATGVTGASAMTGAASGVERQSTAIEAADAIGSTTGAGSSGMGSTGMGSNRNY